MANGQRSPLTIMLPPRLNRFAFTNPARRMRSSMRVLAGTTTPTTTPVRGRFECTKTKTDSLDDPSYIVRTAAFDVMRHRERGGYVGW